MQSNLKFSSLAFSYANKSLFLLANGIKNRIYKCANTSFFISEIKYNF